MHQAALWGRGLRVEDGNRLCVPAALAEQAAESLAVERGVEDDDRAVGDEAHGRPLHAQQVDAVDHRVALLARTDVARLQRDALTVLRRGVLGAGEQREEEVEHGD